MQEVGGGSQKFNRAKLSRFDSCNVRLGPKADMCSALAHVRAFRGATATTIGISTMSATLPGLLRFARPLLGV